MKYNLNDYVRIRITEEGRKILSEDIRWVERAKDDKWQLWELMHVFGPHIYNGCEPPFEMEIELLP